MGIIPPPPPPATTRGYYLYSATGHYLAVEFVGWQPARAIGPLAPADLEKPIDSLDWPNAMAEHGLNVRFLVALDAAELAHIKSGRKRTSSPRPARGVGTGPAALSLSKAGIKAG